MRRIILLEVIYANLRLSRQQESSPGNNAIGQSCASRISYCSTEYFIKFELANAARSNLTDPTTSIVPTSLGTQSQQVSANRTSEPETGAET